MKAIGEGPDGLFFPGDRRRTRERIKGLAKPFVLGHLGEVRQRVFPHRIVLEHATSNGRDQEAHSVDEMHAPSLLPGLGLQQVHPFPTPRDDDVLRQVGEEPVHTRAADQQVEVVIVEHSRVRAAGLQEEVAVGPRAAAGAVRLAIRVA